jgi:hypothetical protein
LGQIIVYIIEENIYNPLSGTKPLLKVFEVGSYLFLKVVLLDLSYPLDV